MSHRFFITLPNPAAARGSDPAVSFHAHGADAFAQELQEALEVAVQSFPLVAEMYSCALSAVVLDTLTLSWFPRRPTQPYSVSAKANCANASSLPAAALAPVARVAVPDEVMVTQSPCNRPAFSNSFMTWGMPPAR